MDAVGLPVGTRVKLRPHAGGDVFDLALAGKTAVVDVEVAGPRLTVTIRNTTPWVPGDREEALEHALCSTHTLLVGDDSMLSAPIILEDHPRIAPESPGDLFDGGEIDGLLALNIMALTDAEKDEMRADPRTREILERTESLTEEQLWTLSGYRLERE